MKYATLRRYALSLPQVTEAPHHHLVSFRVGGKIFVTVPPGEEHAHMFVPGPLREPAITLHPAFVEPLRWGGKVVGIRLALAPASAAVAKRLLHAAWTAKAPAALRSPGA